MMLNHEAIRRAYPSVVTINDSTGAFDVEGNLIELDQSLVDAAAVEVASEQQLAELRKERNRRLAETDYLALSDATLSEEMRTYRQALRDLPDNTSDPANPTWPVKPS